MNQPESNSPPNNISLHNYNLVNKSYFQTNEVPLLSIYNLRFAFNPVCVSLLDTDYVHLLISEEEKKIVLLPTQSYMPEAIKFTFQSGAKKTKILKSPIFFFLVMDLMKWNPLGKYIITGSLEKANSETALVFDLSQAEIYLRVASDLTHYNYSPLPLMAQDWKNRFGFKFEEHTQQSQIQRHVEYIVIESTERNK